MSLGLSYSLFVFRKHYTCHHKFGCIEAFLRKTFKAMTFWIATKGLIELISNMDIGKEIISIIKDNWAPASGLSQEDSELAWFGMQTLMITGVAFFTMRRCWTHIMCSSSASPTQQAGVE